MISLRAKLAAIKRLMQSISEDHNIEATPSFLRTHTLCEKLSYDISFELHGHDAWDDSKPVEIKTRVLSTKKNLNFILNDPRIPKSIEVANRINTTDWAFGIFERQKLLSAWTISSRKIPRNKTGNVIRAVTLARVKSIGKLVYGSGLES